MGLWIFAFILGLGLFIFTARKKFPKKLVKLLVLILEIFFLGFFLFKIIFPLNPGPKASGPFEVQETMVYYSHQTQFPSMATRGGEREIPVHLYGPKDLEDQGHPLFIFSHGSFGLGTSNQTLFRQLASQGYIVMSLDHPYHSFFTSLSSGEKIYINKDFFFEVISSKGVADLEGTLASLNSWLAIRLEDLNFVLDKLLDHQVDNIYEEKIDPTRITLSGHSLGGSAALALGRHRPDQIRNLVILEAPFAGDIVAIEDGHYVFVEDPYPRPILHLYSDALKGKMENLTTYKLNQDLIDLKDPKFVNVYIDGLGHLGLTDMSLASPILTDLIDGGLNEKKPPESLLEINSHVEKFLEEN
ncbi:MAG: hypothetical protein Q4E36_05500 [Bacillota bacterium]|nr:hypothetical protein [Bacillota bacterium]